ncbi:CidA/LrgA family protein [Cupriavidus sp. D384]|uniref:CidA/LrgA family protein n=1 Tax=Cupriavidus sp. D384 TaxID=1538095 RepID=UPI0008335655|nr:CidA/LrgA family protein [Cupriavidus sp. D384]
MPAAPAVPAADGGLPAPSRFRRLVRTAAQVAALLGIWFAADWLTRTLGWSMSPGVVGLLAVLGLLLSGKADVGWVKDGADWLLGELVLFFIPCVVAVVNYLPLFRSEGVQLTIAVAVGTVLVMAATALAVHAGCRLERKIRRMRGRPDAE